MVDDSDQLSHTINDGDQDWSSEAALIDKAKQENSEGNPLGLICKLASRVFTLLDRKNK